jgi:hypothetical protein
MSNPRPRFASKVLTLALPLALSACDPSGSGKDDDKPGTKKIEPATTSQQAALNAEELVRQAGQSVKFLGEDDSVLSRMLRGGQDASNGLVKTAEPPPRVSPLGDGKDVLPVVRMLTTERRALPMTAEDDFDRMARDVGVLLSERVLVASNVESQTATEIVYLLKPDPTCRPLPSSLEPGQTAGAPDPDCVEKLPKLQVRVVVRGEGDGHRLTVRLGPDRHELVAFVVQSSLLAAELDLAKSKQAVDFANKAVGDKDAGEPWPFERLEGRLRFALEKLAAKSVRASIGLLEPLALDEKDGGVSVRIAKSDRLVAFTADGAAKRASVAVGLGKTEVKTTWDPRDRDLRNRDLHVSIDGLHGEVTLEEDKKEVAVKDVGVGHAFVAVRGMKIFELDFNPDHGRKMNVLAKLIMDDLPRIELLPRLDLAAAFKLMLVASDYDSPPPKELADEAYKLLATPAGAGPVVLEARKANPARMFEGGVKVVSGQVSLSAKTAPASKVEAAAGKCITSREKKSSDEHPWLGTLQVVDCD